MALRKIYDINEFIDIMSSIKNGAFATVCYLSSAKVKKTLRGSDVEAFGNDLDSNRTEGDDEYYNTLKQYQGGSIKKFPYNGVVKMSRIQFNWQSEKKYGENFGKYADARDALITKYGGEPVRKQGTDTRLDYGTGDVSVGSTDNTQGRLYSHQNGATVNYLDEYYFLVDTNGQLKGGISKEAIKNIVAKSGDADGVAALKRVNASDETIKSYLEELKALKFRVLKLMYDSVLFVVATVDDEKIFFWNSKLANQVGSGSYVVAIDPVSFKEKAKELYRKSYEEIENNYTELMQENRNMKSNKIKITENDIKYLVAESVKRILREYDDDEIDYEGNGYEPEEWNYEDDDFSELELAEHPESYYWYVYVLGKEKKSTKRFNSVKEAVIDCNNFLKKINFKEIAAKYNFDEDKVCALIEIGDDEWSDTMLQNYGWGWMD